MAVRKRGGRWHYDFMIRRVRYRGTLPEARTKDQAQRAENQVKEDVYNGRYGKPTGDTVFIEYAENEYLPWSRENKRSWKDDEYHVETFRVFFKGKTFREITAMLIEKFKKERRQSLTRKGEQLSAASVNRELASLSKIISRAVGDKKAATNPCSQVKKYRENNERSRYLTADEEVALFAALAGPRAYLQPIVQIAIHTGMRRGEILGMKYSWVDFARGCIRIPGESTKNGKPRTVPMNQVVRDSLAQRQGAINEATDWVFKNSRTGAALCDVKKSFAAACVDAKIDNFRFHDLRHTFGTRLADTGADPFVIAEIMGHSDLRMTKRYCHATDHRKQGAVERIADYRAPEKIVTRLSQRGA